MPAELAAAERERAELLALLRSEDLLPPTGNGSEPDEAAIVVAMHRFLAATPSRLKLISPYDVLAEPRQPQPSRHCRRYPNWRIPLPPTLEELRSDPEWPQWSPRFTALEHLLKDKTG